MGWSIALSIVIIIGGILGGTFWLLLEAYYGVFVCGILPIGVGVYRLMRIYQIVHN